MVLPPICNTQPTFRGWTKPGPLPSLPDTIQLAEDETVDALCGHFRIFQLRDGHRFSSDDVLTAWYGTTCCPSVGSVLDLGSGIGSVAMTAAWRLPKVNFVTIEAQDRSVSLARRSVAYNGLQDRFDIRHGDIRDPSILGDEETFDLILGSPPYWPTTAGIVSEHPQKAACRFELRGDIADYCQVAVRHLKPGGLFACVFPADQRPRARAAAEQAGLTIVRSRAVVFREGDAPRVDLWAMHRKVDLPPEFPGAWEESPIIIRTRNGEIHPEFASLKLAYGFPP